MNRRLPSAFRAASVHLLLSALIATALATLVFGWWYPFPYRELAGGQQLFWTVMAVDVVCGPLLTAVVFNPQKSRRELVLDLSLVVLIQIGALIYGVYSVALARPVVLAYEIDRFVAVPAVDVDTPSLSDALPDLRFLSWTGPKLVGTRKARDGKEASLSLTQSLQGLQISARPGWWIPYEESVPDVKLRMRKLDALRAKLEKPQQSLVDEAAVSTGEPVSTLFYLPLTSRELTDWIVLLDAQAQIKGYAQVDGF